MEVVKARYIEKNKPLNLYNGLWFLIAVGCYHLQGGSGSSERAGGTDAAAPQAAVSQNQTALELSRELYTSGLGDFLALLDAER